MSDEQPVYVPLDTGIPEPPAWNDPNITPSDGTPQTPQLPPITGPDDLITAIRNLTKEIRDFRTSLKQSASATSVKTLGYDNHWFYGLAYTSTAITVKDLYVDLRFKHTPEQLIVQPTTDAFVDFDNQPDVTNANYPFLAQNQSLTVSLHVTKVHVQGKTASGNLWVLGFW